MTSVSSTATTTGATGVLLRSPSVSGWSPIVTDRIGGTVSRVTVRTTVVSCSTASTAVTVTGFGPSTSVTVWLKAPSPANAASAPLTVTRPRWASRTEPATVRLAKRVTRPSAGAVRSICGASVSRWYARSSSVTLPAASTARSGSTLGPSCSRATPAALHSRQPPADPPSTAATPPTETVTASSLTRPATSRLSASWTEPGSGVMPSRTGGLSSIVKVRLADDVLPASSMAVTAKV